MIPSRYLKPVLGVAAVAAVAVAIAMPVLGSAQADPPPEAPRLLPAPAAVSATPVAAGQTQSVVLAGGCFWGVQGVFAHVKGVKKVVSGYAGGGAATANYELVSTGTTGHAESVQIVFDPAEVAFGEVLRIFFSVATDPTQLDHQYPDEGPQYRSEIFYSTPEQAAAAKAYIAQLDQAKAFRRPIVTKIEALKGFYPAEAYHQDYLTLHPRQPYIAEFDIPKVKALKALFPSAYRDAPVLVNAKS